MQIFNKAINQPNLMGINWLSENYSGKKCSFYKITFSKLRIPAKSISLPTISS